MWKRTVVWRIGAGIAVLLIGCIGLFLATRSWFITRITLPVFSRINGVRIVAESAEWHIFQSEFRLKNLRIGPAGEPYFKARQGAARYSWKTLSGKGFILSDVRLSGADFTLYRNRFGAWGVNASVMEQTEDSGTGREHWTEPCFIDLRNVQLEKSRFVLVFGEPNASSALEVRNLAFRSSCFRNGEPFDFVGSGELRSGSSRDWHIDSGRVQLALKMKLSKHLSLETLDFQATVDQIAGDINAEAFKNDQIQLDFSSRLQSDRLEVRQFDLRQLRDGKSRSCAKLTGWTALSKLEFEAQFQELQLSSEVLSALCDFYSGVNPGTLSLNYQGKASYLERCFAASGRLNAERSGLAILGGEPLSLPSVRISGSHDFRIDFNHSSLELNDFCFDIEALHGGVSSFKLRKPVKYSWLPETVDTGARAEFDLSLRNFDLGLYRLLRPTLSELFELTGGRCSGTISMELERNLSRAKMIGMLTVADPVGRVGKYPLNADGITWNFSSILRRNLHFSLERLFAVLKVRGQVQTEFSMSGEGQLQPTPQWNVKYSLRVPDCSRFTAIGAEVSSRFRKELKEWNVREAMLSGECAWEEKSGRLSFPKTALGFSDRNGKKLLSVTAGPQQFDVRSEKLLSKNDVVLKFYTSLGPVNRFFPGNVARFEKGAVTGDARLIGGAQWNNLRLDGRLKIEDPVFLLTRRNGEKIRFDDCSGEISFSAFLPDLSVMEVNTANFYLRRSGGAALRIDVPGSFNFREGAYFGRWSLQYANDNFLRFFWPNLNSQIRFGGEVEVALSEHFKHRQLAVSLQIERLVLPNAGELAGELAFQVEQTPQELILPMARIQLTNGDKRLLGADGSLRRSLSKASGKERIDMKLHTDVVDFEHLYELLLLVQPRLEEVRQAFASGKHPVSDTPPQIPLPSYPVDLSLDLQNIQLEDKVEVSLKGDVKLREDRLLAGKMKMMVNGTAFPLRFFAVNEKNGIHFDLAGASRTSLPLCPVLEMLLPGSQEGLAGNLSGADFRFNWLWLAEDGASGKTVNGNCRFEFRDLLLTKQSVTGLFGRLLLFPVNMSNQLGRVVASQDAEELKKHLSAHSMLPEQLPDLEFYRGVLSAGIRDGVMQLDDCSFEGALVRRLSFLGSLELGGAQKLHLLSKMNIAGSQLSLPIGGTLPDPEVKAADAFSHSFLDVCRKLRQFNLVALESPADSKNSALLQLNELPSADFIVKARSMLLYWWQNPNRDRRIP